MPERSSLLGRNYFLIQLSKKYIVIIVLFSFKNSPYIACTISGIIFLASALLTMYHRPYTNPVTRTVKILGEVLFATAWFLHVVILIIEEKLNRSSEFNSDTINNYLTVGNVVMIILFIFNLIFFTEYFIKVYVVIRDF